MTRQASRRARIRFAPIAVALVASACAGASGVRPGIDASVPTIVESSSTTSGASTTAPLSVYGGTVVIGLADGGAPRTLNPYLDGPDAAVLDVLAPALFAQGFDIDPSTGAKVPDALAAVPSVAAGTIVDNGDGTMEVTVEVVDGATWSDGPAITAGDLEFTYRIAVDGALPIRRDIADLYSAIVPGSTRAEGRKLTFRMRTGTDPADLFRIIIPRHEVEGTDFATDWDERLWASGGPFVLSDWQPGQFIELSRNDAYWKVTAAEGAPLPFLDRVIVRFYEPGDALDSRLVDGFERGEVTVAVFGRAEDRLSELDAAVASGAVVETAPGGEWEHLNFQFGPANRNPESQNASTDFRRAVAFAIDRTGLAAARRTVRADSILQRFLPGLGSAPFAAYEFDLRETNRLLAGTQPPVVVTVPGGDPAGLALGGDIVTELRAAGFEAELQLEDADLFFGATLDNGSWDTAIWRFGGGSGLGAAAEFMRFFDPDGLPFVGDNFFRWGTVDSRVNNGATQRYRELIDAIDRTADPRVLAELLVEAEQILADEVVLLPLVLAGDEGVGYWPEAVRGVSINPAQGPLWNIDTWRVPAG